MLGVSFDAGLITEVCLRGNMTIRRGKKLYWDPDKMRMTNNEAANQYIKEESRTGW